MHAAIKVLVGLIMIVIGLGMFADEIAPVIPYYQSRAITHFFIVFEGLIPIFLILIGLFVVWLEVDELKAQKELSREEAKPEPKKEEKEDKKEEKK
ncbi:MAG: hypothetical protein KKB03_03435 [Nanoarchaeota archaeon]|nr:hypothetical protein [Nanoarchaeota archaeon]MBU1134923.1 hypothetical protein [Nanoarchaeota archaeon]MBU2520266.1 hypothetical protein [Nanoarchaeota archaeon]